MLSDEGRSGFGGRLGNLQRCGPSRIHKRIRSIGDSPHQTGKTKFAISETCTRREKKSAMYTNRAYCIVLTCKFLRQIFFN